MPRVFVIRSVTVASLRNGASARTPIRVIVAPSTITTRMKWLPRLARAEAPREPERRRRHPRLKREFPALCRHPQATATSRLDLLPAEPVATPDPRGRHPRLQCIDLSVIYHVAAGFGQENRGSSRRSQRRNCCRFSRYQSTVEEMPARRPICDVHPVWRSKLTSSSFCGVPSGLLVSQRVSPV